MTGLELAVKQAAESFSQNGKQFHTGGFQKALSDITNSTPMITPQIAELILTNLPYVRRDSECYWFYNLLK